MDEGGGLRAAPFASQVFRWRAVGGDKPFGLTEAETIDGILGRYSGYTLTTLLAEDAHGLLQIRALLDDDLGKADD